LSQLKQTWTSAHSSKNTKRNSSTTAASSTTDFKREESVKRHDGDRSVIHVGMDFNLDPMSAVLMTRKGDTLHVFDEIVMFGSNTDEMVAELRERYGNGTIVIYPDPASRQRKTSAGGRTDLSILQNAGFEVRVRNSHAAVRDRINAVNSRLLSNDGQRRLYVDPKCKKVIESLERHTYKEGTSQPEKDGFDHMNDALGYAVEYLFPIRKAQRAAQPRRGGRKCITKISSTSTPITKTM
jgi:hypothetical protein